jgi:hypothetical protein
VQPRSERFPSSDGDGFPGEDQEGGLKGVFGVLFIAEDPSTDSKHQCAMPLKQSAEGLLVTALDESAEEIPILLVAPFGSSEDPNVPENLHQGCTDHV